MNDVQPTAVRDALPAVVIALMKGVVERDHVPVIWQDLMRFTSQVRDYLRVMGLELILNDVEGYA